MSAAATSPAPPFESPPSPEAAAEWVPIDSLHPWEHNPRKNEKAIAAVAKSIKRFGFGAPILARKEDSEIIAGHTRWAAAKKLKLPRVPVRFMDLDAAEAHILALADNKLGEVADWDKDLLPKVLCDLRHQDVDVLTGTGFDKDEVAQLLAHEDTIGQDGGTALGAALVYRLIVQCNDESHQAEVFAKLQAEGLACRPIIRLS